MQRLRPFDRLLLGTLVPLWALCFGLSVTSARPRLLFPAAYVAAPERADAYPTVEALPVLLRPQPLLKLGDRVVAVGGADLRGVGPIGFQARAVAGAAPDGRVSVVVERGERRLRGSVSLASRIPRWPYPVVSLSFAATAVLALLRAPASRMVQTAFHAMMCVALYLTGYFGATQWAFYVSLGVQLLSLTLLLPLMFRAAATFGDPIERPRWARGWPWGLGALGPLFASLKVGGPVPPAVALPIVYGILAVFWGALFAIAIDNYYHAAPLDRRRWRWIFLSAWLSGVPQLAGILAATVDPERFDLVIGSQLALVTFPVLFLVAVFQYDLLDVDRLLSATATSLLLLVVFVGSALVLLPRAAAATSSLLGIGAAPAQMLVFLLLALLILSLGQRLQPLVDGWLRPEQRALERGVAQLLRDLSTCRQPREVLALVGERLVALLRPRGSVVYAHAGGGYVPVFVSGTSAPPPIRDGTPLVGDLEARAEPLALDQRRGSRPAVHLGEVDRAMLEALGVVVLVPVRRQHHLAAFVCLASKRSGDVYTSTELTLLAAVAEKASGELGRLRDEETIRRAQAHEDEAKRANLAKSALLAAASHDLRQPLHALSLFAGALGDRASDAETQRLVKSIQVSAQAMEEMFSSVLDLSRLDAGVIEVNVTDVPLGPLIERLRSEFDALAEARGLGFRAVTTTLVARSDPVLLRRILQNLVTNALRYTGEGRVLLGCRRAGSRIRIAVCDTGPGIAPEDRQRIFEEYERGRSGSGLGLGLAIVRRLVELLGHELALRSTPGRGSLFTVTVPRGRPGGLAAAPPVPQDRLAGTLIVVIDDDATILDGTRALLESWRCQVLTASSGRVACAAVAAETTCPAVIIADHRLGNGETGADAITALRAALGRPVPALVVTGETLPDDLEEARASGFLLLTKPVAPVRLRAALDHLVRGRAIGISERRP